MSTLELRRPWWPYDMHEYVQGLLAPGAAVFEYGGGGSSLWFHDSGVKLAVVEHDANWIKQLREILPTDVQLIEAPPQANGTVRSAVEDGYFDEYVKSIDTFANGVFDLVVVDGRARVDCVLRARDKVKPGGHLLLDDSDRERYDAANDAMASWHVLSFRGLKVGSSIPATTTIWQKPV
ncbi:hypothetical protein [Mycolicibacterium sp. OfavD-34-C]|uniref:hypothetical protein n=1 Tax=Mycolicibacterium sp. OfavD-34-C TaxID=2917746 RepID=UPI001EF63352|nr:hypothetical protein [Mycolicibacterium sp. OfavD-34-C]MCG7580087.1 hypothetical protein [Mycolicibacterium sp. OfavD-34-C]